MTKTGLMRQFYLLFIGRKWAVNGEWKGEVAKLSWDTFDMQAAQEPAESLSMNAQNAQILMDSLWDAGIRPTEGAGSAGAMAAAQEHLKDMRKLVFK